MNKKTKTRIFFTLFLVLWIAFIFSNSLPSIDESAETSNKVLEIVNFILATLKIPLSASEHFIRKTAHFVEFFILGITIYGFTVSEGKHGGVSVLFSSFFSCLIAMTDETIQSFTGRGSMLLDVWLDLFGALIAIVLLFSIYSFKQKRSK